MEPKMKTDRKTEIKQPPLTAIQSIDLAKVTGGKQVGSLPMVQGAARTCFCARLA
jgi:hypothetical protein